MKYRRPFLVLIAALLFMPPLCLRAGDAGSQRLAVELLTRDLGDPRAPSNLKIALQLPDSLAHRLPAVKAEDFSVHVFPDDTGPGAREDESNRASGVYLWRNGRNVFLDVRQVPIQDKEGEATVLVRYHPDNGPVIAEGVADARCTYRTQLVDVFLAIDISSSMNYTDPKRRRVVAARTFIEMAREGGGIGRVGLITFNSRARLYTPLLPLDQGENLLNALRRVGANGLTSLDAPLQMGLEQFAESGDSARPVIILLTDGRNEGSRYRDTHLQCAEMGIRLYTIGLTERADHNLLKIMAESTGGMYFRAPTNEDLPEIYARLAAELGKRRTLRTELLAQPAGDVRIPIDASVRRLVAIVDGGARVKAVRPDGSPHAGGRFANVHMISPAQGDWTFSWMDAAPDVSAFSLSGDSRFFLDLFPPQYRPGKIALGATLAEGERPLGNAQVWLEPVPGILDQPVQLFDDGSHGDGEAGDGVYGALADMPEYAPERLNLIARAAGAAWNYGNFVRQASGVAVQMPDPPVEGTVRLESDIDFGVLFPGETGTAVATIDLDAKIPREMHFDLLWNSPGWPDLSSSMLVDPGRHAFELEMTVPSTAEPGEYEGVFSISDRGIIHDDSRARLKVGTVRFGGAGLIDLGIVPPGTFVSRKLLIPYTADKGAGLAAETVGNTALTIAAFPESIPVGAGEFPLELMVSVPLRTPEGGYEAVVNLKAGPGSATIPLRWQVKEYDAPEPEEGAPLTGLPAMPDLTEGVAFLPPPGTSDLSVPDQLEPLAMENADGSPWEKASRALRNHPEPTQAVDPSALQDFRFPEPESDAGGASGFWSAWWMYLLAILLLLLLLLLLIVYILYRLGKSALARFLLVSGIANLILLAAFIALLSTASGARSEGQRLAVSLVEDEYQPAASFSDAELGMLGSASSSGAGAGGGNVDEVGEIVFDNQSAEPSGILAVRSVELPDNGSSEIALADSRQPSVMPLDNPDNQPLRRRERRTDRPERPLPETALPEISEPAAAPAEQAGLHLDIGEVRLQLETPEQSERPAWSDGERVAQSFDTAAGIAAPEPVGTETVALEPEQRRIDPRGRRRTVRDLAEAIPEPRVEIFDPARDAEQFPPSEPADAEQADPGIEEIRPEPRAATSENLSGEKPGTVILPGIAMFSPSNVSQSSLPGNEPERRVQPRGGLRSSRGGDHDGAPVPTMNSIPGGSAASQGRQRGNGATPGSEVSQGEMRFDELPLEGEGVGSGMTGRMPRGLEIGGVPASLSPSAGAGDASRLAYGDMDNGGLNPGGALGDRDAARRNGNAASQPGGLSNLPAGSGGTSRDGGNGLSQPGTGGGESGPDEGRFDSHNGMPNGAGGPAGRRPGAGGGLGRSNLGGGGSGGGLRSIPFDSGSSDWRRNVRRDRRRSVNVAASSVDKDSLLIVVGDFARLPDPAAGKLFAVLADRLSGGLTVEDRRVAPGDATLADCLLSLLTPEEARDWSGSDIQAAADYLATGGHIWLDAPRRGQADDFMSRLASAAGGRYGPLSADHQLAAFDTVDAVTVNGNVVAVATALDWRKDWRYGRSANGPTLRFLIRALNYFLSGNAETGIVLESDEVSDRVEIQPYEESIPELLASGSDERDGIVWTAFGTDSETSWRMPAWSDPGSIAAVSDGQGGRALKLDLDKSSKGRAAVYKTLSPPEDLSGAASISLDAYHDGTGEAALSMVFTVAGGSGWKDFETRPVRLRQGWNSVVFHLDDNQFRSLADSTGYESALAGAGQTGRAGLFFYRRAETPAVVLIRNVRLHDE